MEGSVDGVNDATPRYRTDYIADGITTGQQEIYSDGEGNTCGKISKIGYSAAPIISCINPFAGACMFFIASCFKIFGGKGKG